MNVRNSRIRRLVVVAVVASMPIAGIAGVASAKGKHHKAGGGSGGGNSTMIVTVAPNNPLIEVGQSEIDAVIQVETQPGLAGTQVEISSQQLQSSCAPWSVVYDTFASGTDQTSNKGYIDVYLDNEGNATVAVQATDCAPGSDLVEADLNSVPFYTATTELQVMPPSVTTPNLYAFPAAGNTNNGQEVETGDTCTDPPPGPPGPPPGPECTGKTDSGDSDVYAVFVVEEQPVYAEQYVSISSQQLQSRCLEGGLWLSQAASVPTSVTPPVGDTPPGPGGYSFGPGDTTLVTAWGVLDDDGNAAFIFKGASCAAGPSLVEGDVQGGFHDTFSDTFTVLPPAVTI
jgi:hypothetical protein